MGLTYIEANAINRTKDIARRIIEKRRERYQVGGVYFLMVEIPNGTGNSDGTHPEIRECTCTFKNDHWALFEYISPYTGNLMRRGYRYLDIVEVNDPEKRELATYHKYSKYGNMEGNTQPGGFAI